MSGPCEQSHLSQAVNRSRLDFGPVIGLAVACKPNSSLHNRANKGEHPAKCLLPCRYRRAWRVMKRRFRALSILPRPERLYRPIRSQTANLGIQSRRLR